MRGKAIAGLRLGDVFTVSRTFRSEEIDAFGDLTRDYNPVHYEPGWVETKGFSGPILHGLLTASMVCEVGGQLAWLATGMDFRYLKPVYPGDTITLTLTVTSLEQSGKATASAEYKNQHGELVVTGELYGMLPQGPERRILQKIVNQGDKRNKLKNS